MLFSGYLYHFCLGFFCLRHLFAANPWISFPFLGSSFSLFMLFRFDFVVPNYVNYRYGEGSIFIIHSCDLLNRIALVLEIFFTSSSVTFCGFLFSIT